MQIQAIKTVQSNRVVYQITATFDQLEKILTNSVNDGSDILHQFQRPIERKRAEDFFEYLYWRLREKKHFTIPNLVGCFLSEDNYLIEYENGILSFPEIYRFSCVDGQHRLAGIKNLLENCPKETYHHVGITLIECPDLRARQQVFADINSNAKQASKAQSLEFDHSSEDVKLSKSVRDTVPIFSLLCERDLSKNQPTKKAIISLYVLHKLIHSSIEDLISIVSAHNHDYGVYYSAYWDAVSDVFYSWKLLTKVSQDNTIPQVIKDRKIWEVKRTTFAFSGVTLVALSKLFLDLMGLAISHRSKWLNAPDKREWLKAFFKEKLTKLETVDFCLEKENAYFKTGILRETFRKDGTAVISLSVPRNKVIAALHSDFINKIRM